MLKEPLADWQSWIISLAHFLSHSPGWFETFSSLLKPQISLPTAFPARVLASYLIKNLHELSSPTLSTVLHLYLHVLSVLLLLRSSPQPIFHLCTKSHIPSCPLKDSTTAVPRCPHHSDPGTSILYLITAIGMLFLLLFKKKKKNPLTPLPIQLSPPFSLSLYREIRQERHWHYVSSAFLLLFSLHSLQLSPLPTAPAKLSELLSHTVSDLHIVNPIIILFDL